MARLATISKSRWRLPAEESAAMRDSAPPQRAQSASAGRLRLRLTLPPLARRSVGLVLDLLTGFLHLVADLPCRRARLVAGLVGQLLGLVRGLVDFVLDLVLEVRHEGASFGMGEFQ